MQTLSELYEEKTGEKAIYRKNGADYHTLKYVRWLEGLVLGDYTDTEEGAMEIIKTEETWCYPPQTEEGAEVFSEQKRD